MKYNNLMRITSHSAITEFIKEHPDAETPLDIWYRTISKGKFPDFMVLKDVFGNKVDVVEKGYVFDIGGNKYRLAASIHFIPQRLFIREIMTHVEYDKEAWKKRHKDFH